MAGAPASRPAAVSITRSIALQIPPLRGSSDRAPATPLGPPLKSPRVAAPPGLLFPAPHAPVAPLKARMFLGWHYHEFIAPLRGSYRLRIVLGPLHQGAGAALGRNLRYADHGCANSIIPRQLFGAIALGGNVPASGPGLVTPTIDLAHPVYVGRTEQTTERPPANSTLFANKSHPPNFGVGLRRRDGSLAHQSQQRLRAASCRSRNPNAATEPARRGLKSVNCAVR
jgi:hypothetical protein